MGLNIYTNNMSIVSQHNLGISNNTLTKSIERLSSGLRINGAEDDASGMAISEKLRGQIKGMARASMNAQDAISYLQTAEVGLEVISDMLHRMRELAVQAGNASYTANDRRELQKEVDQLKSEIDRVASATEFNAQKLLSGDTSAVWSASTDEINALMNGQPVAEGNYRLDFQVQPGQNAVYKTSILLDHQTFEEALEAANAHYAGIEYQHTRTINIPAAGRTVNALGTLTYNSTNSGAPLSLNFTQDELFTLVRDRADVSLDSGATLVTLVIDDGPNVSQFNNLIQSNIAAGYFDALKWNPTDTNNSAAGYGYVSRADGTYATVKGTDFIAGLRTTTSPGVEGTLTITKTAGGYDYGLYNDFNVELTANSTPQYVTGTLAMGMNQIETIAPLTTSSSDPDWGNEGNVSAKIDYNAVDSLGMSVGDTIVYHFTGGGYGLDSPYNGRYDLGARVNYFGIPELNPGGRTDTYSIRSARHGLGTIDVIEAVNGEIKRYSLEVPKDGSGDRAVQTVTARLSPADVSYTDPGYNLEVEDQNNRTDLAAIGGDADAGLAGVTNLKSNGEAGILYDATVEFTNIIPGLGNGLSALVGTYSTAGADSYVDTYGAGLISGIDAARSGYLEVSFTTDAVLDTNTSAVGAIFTFVDAETGERRTITNPPQLTTSGVRTLDFGNGVRVALNFTQQAPENIINTDDKILFSITGSGVAGAYDTYATITLQDDGYVQAGPAVLIKNGNMPLNGTTLTAVKLTQDGDFREANLHWTVDTKGRLSDRFTVLQSVEDSDPTKILKGMQLKDLPAFTNSDRRMLLDNTQVITIYGNDKEVDIAIEGSDSLETLMYKLGDAVVNGLNMGADNVLPYDIAKLITATGTGNFAVMGTIVLQTAMVGKQSELKFVGEEEVLHALGLVQIQSSKESEMYVTVTNAHNNALVGSDLVMDRMLRGIIDGVDVKIDSRVGLNASLDQTTGEMHFTANHGEMAYLHVANRQTNVQVGANEGVQLDISVARVDTIALEIDGAYLMTMEDSQKAITKFELALARVSRIRSHIGSQVNRMEDAMRNLATGGQKLIAANSRIKDLDVAEESALFAKNQVLVNAAVAMLAQANQQPQTAMQLIGGQ